MSSSPALERIAGHPCAPRWNRAAGDRLTHEDVRAVEAFRRSLAARRAPFAPGAPPGHVVSWVAERRALVPSFRERIAARAPIAEAWADIATSSREDVAVRPESLVPDDAPLERMIVYRTAGTTGHALLVPHDARAAACYLPLIEVALERHGASARFDERDVVFLVGAQAHTVTYATALSAWGQAGFAKLNLARSEWPAEDAPRRFFADLAPALLTGDPISFAELMARGVEARPRALLTTAVAMSDALRDRLAQRFGAPVIDWYSLTETGPIGYACARGGGYHVVAHDVFVEAVDARGRPLPPGERGEIAVTGGRNAFLPLLRYRTGDWGTLAFDACPCGDPMPRIVALEGRAPVRLFAAGGGSVNPVDVSRVLREHPIVQHELAQRADGACDLRLRAVPGEPIDLAAIERDLRELFGGVALTLHLDPALGDRAGKAVPYRSELPVRDLPLEE
jgi:phenylacetate-CoA ligase